MQTQTESEKLCSVISDSMEKERAISIVKETFVKALKDNLNLYKVEAPLILGEDTGVNDDLNGVEKPVSFTIKNIEGKKASVVQSLAKWKRLRLAQLSAEPGTGIITDMKALRPDDEISPLHSIYVDQWDWEKVMNSGDRNMSFLKTTVTEIYNALLYTEQTIHSIYPSIEKILPPEITFIHTETLLRAYPGLTPKEREDKAAEKFKAFFLIGVGATLSNGEIHDGRAPDYDDWSTETDDGYFGLNGDIIVWHPVLKRAFEISSMGIRVDSDALLKQLEIRDCTERKELCFHKMLLEGQLPQTIGGGIGQSRVSMFMLRKKHVGEVQASIWPDSVYEDSKKEGANII